MRIHADLPRSTTQGISSSSTLNLIIGANPPIIITPASSDLQDLASAINSQSNGQVQATLVNVGSNGSLIIAFRCKPQTWVRMRSTSPIHPPPT